MIARPDRPLFSPNDGGGAIAPFGTVTLLELLEIAAEPFWRMSSLIGQAFVRLEVSTPTLEMLKSAVDVLAELEREARRLQLRSALSQLARIKHELVEKQSVAQLGVMLIELHTRMVDELDDRFFISLPSESVPLYRQKAPPFGVDVANKFSQMTEDISEAAKCLALNRSTASVFHLMRIMEIAVQLFGQTIGVAIPQTKNWQSILDEINKQIKQMDQKSDTTKRYAGTSSHLYNVKLSWRNEVMHPKQTYTVEEARAVFESVGIFIRDLASVI